MKRKKPSKVDPSKKVSIHTIIEGNVYNKILEAGNGRLNDGIVKILDIAESKQYDVKSELKRIAEKILYEVKNIDI